MYTSQPQRLFHANTPGAAATLRCHYLGPHPIIHHYLKRMNLAAIVEECLGSGRRCGKDGTRIEHAQVLEALVHSVIVSPLPLYRISQWLEGIEPSAIGRQTQNKDSFNDDRIARTLELLSSDKGRNLFFRLALRIIKDFSVRTDRIHFDTTSVTFSGGYHTSSAQPRICRGHNKDGRPDLKQLVFGLNISSDGAVPLLHHVYSGNQSDDTVHQPNISALRRLLSRDDFIYVADCKLCSSANLAMIEQMGGKFVTILPRKRKEDTAFRQYLRTCDKAPMWHLLLKVSPPRGLVQQEQDVLCTCDSAFDRTEEGYRLIWVRSSKKARIDKQVRQASIEKAREQLLALASKINRGKLRTRTAIRNAITAILRKNGIRGRGFLTVSLTPVPGKVAGGGRNRLKTPTRRSKNKCTIYKISATLNRENLKREARTDGIYPLITNVESNFGKRTIVEIYKYQPYIEKRFAALKSELVVAPVFLKKSSRVAGMLHVYFIAIALASLVERTVRTNMRRQNIKHLVLLPEDRSSTTPTCPRVLEAFANVAWFECEQENNGKITFPLQLDQRQRQLLRLLEVPQDQYL